MTPLPWSKGRREERRRQGYVERGEFFAARVTGHAHVAVVLEPSDTVGPEPLHVPASGHNVFLEFAANGRTDVTVTGLRAEVLSREAMRPSGVALVPQPGPALDLAPDLAEARRRGLENYRPIEPPDLEIYLDEDPPLLCRASANAAASGLPLAVPVGTTARLVLAPLTDDRRLVSWRLLADVACGEHRVSADWTLLCTAETTMRTAHPDGRQTLTPAHSIAPHWKPSRGHAADDERHRPALRPEVPGGSSGPVGTVPTRGGTSEEAGGTRSVRYQPEVPSAEAPAVDTVKRVHLVPGSWWMDVGHTRIPDPHGGPATPAWYYAGHGMGSVGQREILTLVADPDEAGPTTFPLDQIVALGGLGSRGHRLRAGETHLFDDHARFEIDPRIRGFTYTEIRGRWFDRLADALGYTNTRPLVMLPLLEGEAPVAGEYGQLRVLSMLGEHARVFPYPQWFDEHRDPVLEPQAHAEATLLARTPAYRAPGLCAHLSGTHVAIDVTADEARLLGDRLAHRTQPVTLLLDLPTEAEGLLTWRPGRESAVIGEGTAPTAPARRGEKSAPRLFGNFLLIGRGANISLGAVQEDGFLFALTDRDWHALLTAFRDGRQHHCSVDGPVSGLTVRVRPAS